MDKFTLRSNQPGVITSDKNTNYSIFATPNSKNNSYLVISTVKDNLVDQVKAIPTFHRTAIKDITEKKYHKTFVPYEYTRSGKHQNLDQSEIIHDKPSVPIWILAMIAYMCVIIIIVIAMYLY